MNEIKKKYMLVYLKTGGGHIAPAKAIANYMNKYLSDSTETVLVDGLTEAPEYVRYTIEDGYRILQAKAKWFFEFIYASNKIYPFGNITSLVVSLYLKKYLKKVIEQEKPDVIVSLHFLTIKPISNVIKKINPAIRFHTLVTDPYTAHPIWFFVKKQNFILFSEKLGKKVKKKLPGSSVNVFPFVVDEKFSRRLNEEKIFRVKSEMNLLPEKKVILILGGGDGIPKGEIILKKLIKRKTDASIVMICGRNEELCKTCEDISRKNEDIIIKIYGFVNNVYELINISDVVITKCGASTIMEILLLGKIPVVNDYIWEQEKGNVDFIIENEIGIYEPKIKKLTKKVQKLLKDGKFKKKFERNLEEYNMRNGLPEVVQFLTEKKN